jgi:hypothetical protein
MDETSARRELKVKEPFPFLEKNVNERARKLVQSLQIPVEDFEQYELVNWSGWNG